MKRLLGQFVEKLNGSGRSKAHTPIACEKPVPLSTHDGRVSVQNGKIVVRNPTADGRFPVLSVPDCDLIHVMIDGAKVIGQTAVDEFQEILFQGNV